MLSGGERTRLAVARMLLRPSNTLLLDEPTNHLDLDSKDVLLDALEDYGGTLIIVSHDRYFVEKLATKIIEIGHGRPSSIPGPTRSSSGIRQQASGIGKQESGGTPEKGERHEANRRSPWPGARKRPKTGRPKTDRPRGQEAPGRRAQEAAAGR